VTQNPNRANGRFRPLRKLQRGHRSNLSRNKAFGTANSFKVHYKREEIWGGLLPFSTEPGALDESESRDPHPSVPSHEGPGDSPESGREIAQERSRSADGRVSVPKTIAGSKGIVPETGCPTG
jgi:hypothetical protein